MIQINFSHYPEFISAFQKILETYLKNTSALRGMTPNEMFVFLTKEHFDITVLSDHTEPFWVGYISERDYTHFVLKYM